MVPAAGRSQRNVVAGVEDHARFRQHSVVLDLRLANRGTVVGEDDEFGVSRTQGPQGGLVPDDVLAALDDQRQSAVDVLSAYLFDHTNK